MAAKRSNHTSKEGWLHGCKRAKRSYSTFKVRRGGSEEILLVQGKEQQLHVAGGAMAAWALEGLEELFHIQGQEGWQ